jgi:hypothetical protein
LIYIFEKCSILLLHFADGWQTGDWNGARQQRVPIQPSEPQEATHMKKYAIHNYNKTCTKTEIGDPSSLVVRRPVVRRPDESLTRGSRNLTISCGLRACGPAEGGGD